MLREIFSDTQKNVQCNSWRSIRWQPRKSVKKIRKNLGEFFGKKNKRISDGNNGEISRGVPGRIS